MPRSCSFTLTIPTVWLQETTQPVVNLKGFHEFNPPFEGLPLHILSKSVPTLEIHESVFPRLTATLQPLWSKAEPHP